MALHHLAIPCSDVITSIEKEEFHQLLARLLGVLTVNRLLMIDALLALKRNRNKTTSFRLVAKLVTRSYLALKMMLLRTKNRLLKKQPNTFFFCSIPAESYHRDSYKKNIPNNLQQNQFYRHKTDLHSNRFSSPATVKRRIYRKTTRA